MVDIRESLHQVGELAGYLGICLLTLVFILLLLPASPILLLMWLWERRAYRREMEDGDMLSLDHPEDTAPVVTHAHGTSTTDPDWRDMLPPSDRRIPGGHPAMFH